MDGIKHTYQHWQTREEAEFMIVKEGNYVWGGHLLACEKSKLEVICQLWLYGSKVSLLWLLGMGESMSG